MRAVAHPEDSLQMACVRWFDYQHRALSWALFHVPNGGRRDPREAARFKAMGVRAGVPDLFLILPSGNYHYLAMELKVGKNTQTDYQRQYEININRNGGRYVVIRSLDQFIEEIKNYLKK